MHRIFRHSAPIVMGVLQGLAMAMAGSGLNEFWQQPWPWLRDGLAWIDGVGAWFDAWPYLRIESGDLAVVFVLCVVVVNNVTALTRLEPGSKVVLDMDMAPLIWAPIATGPILKLFSITLSVVYILVALLGDLTDGGAEGEPVGLLPGAAFVCFALQIYIINRATIAAWATIACLLIWLVLLL